MSRPSVRDTFSTNEKLHCKIRIPLRFNRVIKMRLLLVIGLLVLAPPAAARLMDSLPGSNTGGENVLNAPTPPGDIDVWQQRASAGDAFAQWVLASRLLNAGATHRQAGLAALKQSAENGYAQAALDWGRALLNGAYGMAADAPQGLRWIERAEQRGNAEAAYVLAEASWMGWAGAADRTKSVYWLRRAADKGWARAREVLGLMLRDGIEMPQDASEAARWLELAATQGRPDAKFALAEMFSTGQGMAHDDERALRLYRGLAKSGYLPAEQKAAAMVAEGRGEAADKAPLKAFLEKTALAGNTGAAYELGSGLIDGRFGPAERAAGVRWLERAAAADHPLAQYQLAWQGLAAERRVQWLERAAGLGYTPAEFYLGMAYAYGDGVAADDRVAVGWYQRAADKGYAEAQSSLAWRYFQGVTLPHDEMLGIAWSRKGAEQGNELSMRNLSARLLTREEPASRDEALVWMKRLSETGHAFYQNYLGNISSGQLLGFGVRYLNYAEALRWWRKAAVQGNGAAEVNLGNAYLQGFGVPVDVWQAISWYERAATRGEPTGDLHLAGIYQKGNGMLYRPDKARLHLERVERNGNALAKQLAKQQRNPGYRWISPQGQYQWSQMQAEAKAGSLEAQKFLGTAYLQGNLGLPKSLANAQQWFFKAAEQGDADAMNNIGYTLYRGFLGKADLSGAKMWLEKAARGGNTNAMLTLAHMHERGEIGPRDVKKTLGWLVKAAEANNPQAIERLVAVYRNGELEQKPDPKRVAYWQARSVPVSATNKP